MIWAAIQACFEEILQSNIVVNDDEAIDKSVEELTSANQNNATASALKR
jgi:hypothetical protein